MLLTNKQLLLLLLILFLPPSQQIILYAILHRGLETINFVYYMWHWGVITLNVWFTDLYCQGKPFL